MRTWNWRFWNRCPAVALACDFELHDVQVGNESFRPLGEARCRWINVFVLEEGLRGIPVECVYELPDGRYVHVQCGYGRLVRRLAERKTTEVWTFDSPPRATFVDPPNVVRFLRKGGHEIPGRFDEHLAPQAPPPAPPPRPWSHWEGNEFLGSCPARPAHEVDPISEARTLVNLGVRVVQSLRDGNRTQGVSECDLLRMFSNVLFRHYRVDPERWWGEPHSVPPADVMLLDLPWPTKSFKAQEAVRVLQTKLEGVLTVRVIGYPLGHPDFPTGEEQLLAESDLRALVPEIEIQIGVLQDVLKQRAAADAEALQKVQEAQKAAVPSSKDVQLWKLCHVDGHTQKEAARLYQQSAHLPMDQGQVSRACRKVKDWLDAGNNVADLPQADPDMVTMDPAVLDLGARGDGRTPRQRPQTDSG